MKLPKLFGSYLLHYRLAWNETSEVYMGQTLGEFPRVCVVKRIRPELSTLPDFDERFRKDAALLLRLIHGNVVQVLEVGSVDNQPFVAMEHIDGIDVRELVDDVSQRGQLSPEVALYVGLEMCEAVSYICQRRREHVGSQGLTFDQAWSLDVMVSFDGVVKVISPGSVGALRLGQRAVSHVLRSPGYVAPEVILKQPLDARTDVFSVGVALWELFNGEQLIASDPERYVRQVIEGRWRAPLVTRKDVPGDLIRMLSQMLDPDPDRRPITPEAVRAQLVSGLRRMSPAFGSGQMARLLLGRYAKRIGLTEELTERLMRRSAAHASSSPEEAGGRTLTYGRAVEQSARPAPEPLELKPGDRIPGTRYRMVRSLGRGGSAEVFAAQHVDLERQVAIKILAPELAQQQSAISYFRLEARTCSRIGHPNIIDVIDFGELDDGRFFFAMELLRGASLGEILSQERRLPAERAIAILRQIAKALHAAHEHGVIHRDLKPENVMLVDRDGRADFVKVLDFGVMAFASDEASDRVGTPGYMAPEQLSRERPTPRTDVYAMGSTLYETLCGQLPYDGETLEDYCAQQNAGPPPALRSRRHGIGVHPAIERVVHRAMDRDPANRHPSAADFEADLLRAQHEAAIETAWDDLPAPEGLRDRRDGEPRAPRAARTIDLRTGQPTRSTFAVAGALAGLLLLLGALFVAQIWTPAPKIHTDRGTRPPAPPKSDTTHPKRIDHRPGRSASQLASPAVAPADEPPPVATVGAPVANGASNGPLPTPATATKAAPATRVKLPATRGRADGREPARPRAVAATAPRAPAREVRRLLAQGRKLLRQRRLAEAREHFEAALARDPRQAGAALGLAAVAFQRARYDQTVRQAKRAIVLDSRLAAAHVLLGDAYAKLLRRDKALAAWRRALALDPANAVASARMAHIRAGD